jgi:hypothetical protein
VIIVYRKMEYKQWLDNRLLQISIENKGTFFVSFDYSLVLGDILQVVQFLTLGRATNCCEKPVENQSGLIVFDDVICF